jgi:hypothetical protein
MPTLNWKKAAFWRRRHPHGQTVQAKIPAEPADHQHLLDALDGDAADVGLEILSLITDSRLWINRISEVISLDERSIAIRATTIYFTLPAGQAINGSVTEDAPPFRLVPLALLDKRRLNVFHICDEAGTKLPAVTRAVREALCSAGLGALASGVLHGKDLDKIILDDLRAICSEPKATAMEALRRFEEAGDAQAAALNAADTTRAALFRDPTFRGLSVELASNQVILTPVEVARGRERILEFTYEEHIERGAVSWRQLKLVAKRAWIGYLKGIGWRAHKLQFGATSIGDGQSYHLEVAVPPALQLVNPALDVTWETKGTTIDSQEGSYGRVHLATAAIPGVSSGLARVDLRLRPSTLIRPAWYATLFSSLVLTGGGIYLSRVHAADATALLLLAPSLLSIFIGAQSEAPLVTRLAYRLRVLAIVPAACTFVCAALLVVARSDRETGTLWWVATGISWGVWMMLSVAWQRARWRRPPPQPDHQVT